MLLSRLILLVLGALISAHTMAQWHSHQTTRYTTTVELVFWHDDAVRLSPDQIIQSVMQRFDDVDALMSSYIDDSEVSKVNQSAGKSPVTVSSSLFSVIDHAQRISWLSEGAFDISYASVGYFYNYRANKRPNENQLKEGLEKVNFKNIVLDKTVPTVFLERPGMRIDLGGVAKGYAVDLGIEVLKDAASAAIYGPRWKARIQTPPPPPHWWSLPMRTKPPPRSLLPMWRQTPPSGSGWR